MADKLIQSWERILADYGDRIALVDTESNSGITFLELEEMSYELIQNLPEKESTENQLWVLALSDRVKWMAVFLSAIRLGAAVMPVEPQEESRLKEIAIGQGAELLFADSGVKELDSQACDRETFLIKMTSGSTGVPKALCFDERAMRADGQQIIDSMGITPKDINYAIIPLGHSYGLGNLVMPFFMQGTPLIFGSAPYPQVMLEEMQRWDATVLPLVPPLVKALASIEVETVPESLRLVICAGSRLDPEYARRFRENYHRPVHNFYGSSETGGICYDRSGLKGEMDAGVGTALDNVLLSTDSDGRIIVESPAVCPALSSEGAVTLHDFGEIDSEGVLHLKGRETDIVKVAGRRLSLSELEASIVGLTGVDDVYASARQRRSGEPRVYALYSGVLDPDDLREELKKQLPEWKLPKRIYKTDSIVYTERGKKDRTALEKILDQFTRPK